MWPCTKLVVPLNAICSILSCSAILSADTFRDKQNYIFCFFFVSPFLKSTELFFILKCIHFHLNSFIMRIRIGVQVSHVKQSSKTVLRNELPNSPASSFELHGPVSKSRTL